MSDARELLALYAVDALDEDERRAVEDLVARDPAAAAELADLLATAALLGSAAAEPPPAHLRDEVLADVARTEQASAAPDDLPEKLDLRSGARSGALPGGAPEAPEAGADAGADGGAGGGAGSAPGGAATGQADKVVSLADRRAAAADRGRRRSSLARLTLAAAAAAVLAVAVPGAIAWQQHERAVQAEARADLLTELLTAPGATIVRSQVEGGGEAVAVLTDERALLVADGLPDLAEDRTYQLWAMRDGVPVAAGLLEVRDGTVQQLATDYRPGDGLAVSVEPAGGSEQPTTTPVVVLLPG